MFDDKGLIIDIQQTETEQTRVVVDPATITPDPIIVPGDLIEIESLHDVRLNQMALERAFLDKVHKDFYRGTELNSRQKKKRAASKRAKQARKKQRK